MRRQKGAYDHRSMVGSIAEGSAVFQAAGEPETVLRPGDVFFEPEGARG